MDLEFVDEEDLVSSDVELLGNNPVFKSKSDIRVAAGKRAKAKGALFERTVCRLLSKWWGSAFHRTPQSGGSLLNSSFDFAGDVCTNATNFPFAIECKNYTELKFHTIPKHTSFIWKFWKQAKEACTEKRIPLVVFKSSHSEIFVALPVDRFRWLLNAILATSSLDTGALPKYPFLVLVGEIMIIEFSHLLKISPERLIDALSR